MNARGRLPRVGRAPDEAEVSKSCEAIPRFMSSPGDAAGIGAPIAAVAWCAIAGASRSRCRSSVAAASSDARKRPAAPKEAGAYRTRKGFSG